METKKKEYTFSKITYQDIEEIVDIEQIVDDSKFEKWFSFEYKFSEAENIFFNELIFMHRKHLSSYNETHLMARFIIPVLNKVNFYTDKFKDWYNYKLSGELNGYKIGGHCDFMVATGVRVPLNPFFFIQEFKPAIHLKDPEEQLLAEMLIAMKKNKTNYLKGGYVIGKLWSFVFLEKIKDGKYKYYVSKSFDCLDLNNLQQIYINLQAIKTEFYK